jgi:ADP-ribosyl-[dinitrogen reductase] hydrolase
MTTQLTTAQLDRVAGVMLGMACGDALGAGYEFGPPLPAGAPVHMKGGGAFGWAPGEWTDDTSMAIAIAEVAASGATVAYLGTGEARDQIAARWAEWAANAKDVGAQTRAVLSAATRAARSRGEAKPTGDDLQLAAVELHARTGRSGGNGSLMRTAPVALALLDKPMQLIKTAYPLSSLTHPDPDAGWACVIWCLAIRHVVLRGTLEGLREEIGSWVFNSVWKARMDEAEAGRPSDFDRNGWVVQALQGAWSAITTTAPADHDSSSSTAGPAHFQSALEAAVRGGHDTDTVAAIAGALVGGLYGASAVPAHWRRRLHGWPDLRARDLVRLGVMTARGGRPDSAGWPTAAQMDYSTYPDCDMVARHPHDEGVWLGGVNALQKLPHGVDAVVSLCRLGDEQVPAQGVAAGDHVEVWLIDDADPDKNPNLDFVLTDAVAAVAALRAEGKTVLLHCVQAQSRTPAVAALYGARLTGRTPTEALADIVDVLPKANPNRGLRAALERLE